MNEEKINVDADLYISVLKGELGKVQEEVFMLRAISQQLSSELAELKNPVEEKE